MLQKELLEKSVFWTDSTTVLKYMCNERRGFSIFAANSMGTEENPAPEVWRNEGLRFPGGKEMDDGT